MAKIEVVYSPTVVPGLYHKNILYTDNSGAQYYARGGPTTNQSSTVFGSINTEHGAYVPGTIDYVDPLVDTRHRELIVSGDNLSGYWDSIKLNMDNFDSKYHYIPASTNSNTAVDSSLIGAGLPLPNDDGPDEFFSPGSLYNPNIPPFLLPFIPDLIASLPPWLDNALAPINDTPGIAPPRGGPKGDPLVLDLDGDGQIALTDVVGGTYYDMRSDGYIDDDQGIYIF